MKYKMRYKIVLHQSWMGDTLFACNVVKNLTDMGHDVVLIHKWPFMMELINLFGIKHSTNERDFPDYATTIYYSGRIDVFDNPLVDYAKCFGVKENELKEASKFYPLNEKFREKYGGSFWSISYITYDSDWRGRTKLNIDYIISELNKDIHVVPIGGDRFDNDPNKLINSAQHLVDSRLHLGMVGGTTNLAAFMNVKTIGDSFHLYNFYKTNGMSHGYKGGANLTPESFLVDFKPFPHYWADPKHISVNPLANEDEYIRIVKENLWN